MPRNNTRIDPRIEELLEHLYLCANENLINGSENGNWPDSIEHQLVEQTHAQGFIDTTDPATAKLTPKGNATGRDVVRRHRLAERLLCDVLGANINDIHEDACRIEHIIQHGLDEKTCILLGHPCNCPHGKPIPQGECCNRAQSQDLREVKPLCDGKSNEEGIVAYLSTRENREIQKLMAMGILPGVQLRLLQRYPSYVFQTGYSQFTIDRELAEKIYVHWSINAV